MVKLGAGGGARDDDHVDVAARVIDQHVGQLRRATDDLHRGTDLIDPATVNHRLGDGAGRSQRQRRIRALDQHVVHHVGGARHRKQSHQGIPQLDVRECGLAGARQINANPSASSAVDQKLHRLRRRAGNGEHALDAKQLARFNPHRRPRLHRQRHARRHQRVVVQQHRAAHRGVFGQRPRQRHRRRRHRIWHHHGTGSLHLHHGASVAAASKQQPK